jgi:Na+/proline symporter
MVASLFLYIAAVIKLDELTMPKRFWKEDPTRNDPNASRLAYLTDNDLWELQKRMVFYWLYLTMVAASLTAVSLMLMLLPCSPRQMSDEIVRETFSCAVISFIFVLIYFGILYLIVRLLSRDGKSSEQFPCCKRRYHEMQAEWGHPGIVPAMKSATNQEEAI